MSTPFRDELRAKYPRAAESAARGSCRAAVKLQCLECVGGTRQDVRDCSDRGCPLYVVRPYRTEAEQPPRMRSAAQLEADRAAGERLRAARRSA